MANTATVTNAELAKFVEAALKTQYTKLQEEFRKQLDEHNTAALAAMREIVASDCTILLKEMGAIRQMIETTPAAAKTRSKTATAKSADYTATALSYFRHCLDSDEEFFNQFATNEVVAEIMKANKVDKFGSSNTKFTTALWDKMNKSALKVVTADGTETDYTRQTFSEMCTAKKAELAAATDIVADPAADAADPAADADADAEPAAAPEPAPAPKAKTPAKAAAGKAKAPAKAAATPAGAPSKATPKAAKK